MEGKNKYNFGKCIKFNTSGYVDKVVVIKDSENLRRAGLEFVQE